jgi:hypothetical protein
LIKQAHSWLLQVTLCISQSRYLQCKSIAIRDKGVALDAVGWTVKVTGGWKLDEGARLSGFCQTLSDLVSGEPGRIVVGIREDYVDTDLVIVGSWLDCDGETEDAAGCTRTHCISVQEATRLQHT